MLLIKINKQIQVDHYHYNNSYHVNGVMFVLHKGINAKSINKSNS
jgi:hypothetical protein